MIIYTHTCLSFFSFLFVFPKKKKDALCFVFLTVLQRRVASQPFFSLWTRVQRSRCCDSPISSATKTFIPLGNSAAQSHSLSSRLLTQTVLLPLARPNQLTLSLTTVRDSTVSSRLGQGTADWGTMSLSSLPSPAASASTRSLALPSAPGTRPTPAGATPGDEGGLEVLFDPLSPPIIS